VIAKHLAHRVRGSRPRWRRHARSRGSSP
jgi:hypothetical protein